MIGVGKPQYLRKTDADHGEQGGGERGAEGDHSCGAIRDSKDPDGPKLIISPGVWCNFAAR